MYELTCGSLFSGVGGMDVGLAWAGFRHRFFAEIDPFARAVLAARFPGVPIYEDVRDVREDAGHVDLLAGGFPCQDLSVAGKRAGLAGERSGLFHEFVRVADALRPRALLVENVEGLYSSNGGRDFGVVLDALAERGYLAAWRTLDAQHFGVPQRRRRVFVLAIADGDSGAERIGEVLALAEGSGGDSPASDPTWPLTTPRAGEGAPGGGGGDAVIERERERESFPPSRPSGRRDRAGLRATSARTSSGRVVGCLTATYGEQSGQDFGPSGAGLVLPSDLPRREREREERGRERGHGDDPLRGGRLNGAGGPPDRGRGYGVNPGNDEIAGSLVGNSQGGQRTTDLAGAYVVRERERAPGVPQVKKGGERD